MLRLPPFPLVFGFILEIFFLRIVNNLHDLGLDSSLPGDFLIPLVLFLPVLFERSGDHIDDPPASAASSPPSPSALGDLRLLHPLLLLVRYCGYVSPYEITTSIEISDWVSIDVDQSVE